MRIQVYLNFEPTDSSVLEDVGKKLLMLDELIKEYGWEYSGIRNMYSPIKGTDCDETIYEVERAIKEADFLKQYEPYIFVGTLMNSCNIDDIIVKEDGILSEEKLSRYKEYYKRTRDYAHGIVVDDENLLLDGYITYLLAKDDGRITPGIMQVRHGQVFKKVVSGKYAEEINGEFFVTKESSGVWYYELEEAVVPGDMLVVRNDDEEKYICVRNIRYVAGPHDCSIYKPVYKHTGKNMDA